MQAGDKEIMQSLASSTRQNVKAMLEHGNETRRLVRELELELEKQGEQIRQQDQKIAEMRSLLANIQAKVYSGGTH